MRSGWRHPQLAWLANQAGAARSGAAVGPGGAFFVALVGWAKRSMPMRIGVAADGRGLVREPDRAHVDHVREFSGIQVPQLME